MTRATSTSTLGFILWTIGIAIVGWASPILARWWQLRQDKQIKPLSRALRESLLASILLAGGVIALVVSAWAFFTVSTIYGDHQTLVVQNNSLSATNAKLQKDLEWRKHNISTTDAVFPNLIYMLQAFRSFGRDMHGIPCVLYVSAPKETEALASVMVQLAGSDSGCSPFGPQSGDNPDLDPELMEGAIPDAIVVHAAKGEKGADGLFSTLGNQIHLERSYRLLRNPKERWSSSHQGKEHLIWLQFGKSVKWNSELK